METNDNSFSRSGQSLAVEWMTRSLGRPDKASAIRAPESPGKRGEVHRRAQRLHSTALRNLRLYRHLVAETSRRAPDSRLLAFLVLALAELDLSPVGRRAAVVDSWVGAVRARRGRPASSFANAVLRRAAVELAAVRDGDRPIPPGLASSHPDWLVERWRRNFGEAMTDRLLAWNQGTPALYAHAPGDAPPPPDLLPAPWDGFYRLPGGLTPPIRQRLAEGLLTIRDPATRIAVDAVLGAAPRRVLDLCAAPGGKSRALLAAPRGPERVVAVDLPARTDELARNLEPWPGESRVVPADLDTGAGVPPEWTAAFDAVLLDAPCSNTGVLRRKPDAKQRLTPADLDRLPPIQGRLLRNAARFVRPGGVLVYGTCSLEPEENRDVVEAFLRAVGDDFRLETAVHALPPKTGHDGAGVFRLRKSGLG